MNLSNRRCNGCRRSLPDTADYFAKGRGTCRECRNKRRRLTPAARRKSLDESRRRSKRQTLALRTWVHWNRAAAKLLLALDALAELGAEKALPGANRTKAEIEAEEAPHRAMVAAVMPELAWTTGYGLWPSIADMIAETRDWKLPRFGGLTLEEVGRSLAASQEDRKEYRKDWFKAVRWRQRNDWRQTQEGRFGPERLPNSVWRMKGTAHDRFMRAMENAGYSYQDLYGQDAYYDRNGVIKVRHLNPARVKTLRGKERR